MPTIRLTLLCLLTLCSGGAAAGPLSAQVSFAVPAETAGNLEADGLQWVLLVFGPVTASVNLHFDPGATIQTHVATGYDSRLAPGLQPGAPVSGSTQERSVALDARLEFGARPWSSLLLVADRIVIEADGSGILQRASQPPGHYVRGTGAPSRSWFTPIEIPSGQPVLQVDMQEATDFAVETMGLRTALWHNATVSWTDRDCPSGGGWVGTDVPVEGSLWTYEYIEARGNGSLWGSGLAVGLAGGGDRFDLGLAGTVRLPGIRMHGCGANCLASNGSTLTMEGALLLADIQGGPAQAEMSASLAGLVRRAAVDESVFRFGAKEGVAVASGLAIGLVLWRLLLLLRVSAERIWENPNRKRVYEAIQASPGMTLGELMRVTGLAAGNARWHLRKLERAGQIVWHRHGNTLRLFENHGRYTRSWTRLVLLKEPEMGALHDLLRVLGTSSQAAVVAEARERWGWSRTATQERLRRLAEGGLAVVRRRGRLALYSVARRKGAASTAVAAEPPRVAG